MNAASSSAVVFPLLADADSYRACETDLLRDEQARSHWLRVFEDQLPMQLAAAKTCGATEAQIDATRRQFLNELHLIRQEPDRHGRLDILLLDELRQSAFRGHGIIDEMKHIKDRENDAALAALPDRLAAVDAVLENRARVIEILRGMLAGNLFDMGVEEMAAKFSRASVPFEEALNMVPDRPWLVDDADRMADWLDRAPPAKVVVFVDNAGGDLILGLLLLVREFLQRGAGVVLSANRHPSHNDVTHDELVQLMPGISEIDQTFETDALHLVSSGNDSPLIDLCRVSPELADASIGAELLVIVGMGRALETNYSARFLCPALKVAMVKDAEIARSLGGVMYDAVCRFDEAAG